MNETGSAAPVVPADASILTATHLTLIVVLAIVVILAIWWGSRKRRQQRGQQRDPAPRNERVAELPPVIPPVTPSPPPLVDATTAAMIEPARADSEASVSAEEAPIAPVAATAAAPQAAQPVTLLKGLGPKVAARLSELGITSVAQIAALSPAAADELDAELGSFRGRMKRDRWIEQAQLLVSGDRAGYEATFGKLG